VTERLLTAAQLGELLSLSSALLGEKPGGTDRRRVVVRPHVGHTSAAIVLVNLDDVTDVRKPPVRADVPASRAGVGLDEMHGVGLFHCGKHMTRAT
jgi:hypothetical protein